MIQNGPLDNDPTRNPLNLTRGLLTKMTARRDDTVVRLAHLTGCDFTNLVFISHSSKNK